MTVRWASGLALALGCAAPAWSENTVMEPHLAALDRDGDGRVDAREYAAVRWNGPPFATVDRDHDGQLGTAELAWLVRAQAPTRFDGGGHPPVKPPAGMQDRRGVELQHAVESIVWMHTALVAQGLPGLSAPLLADVHATRDPADPRLAEARATLDAQWSPRSPAPGEP